MTVKDLIKKLKKMPQGAEVCVEIFDIVSAVEIRVAAQRVRKNFYGQVVIR